MNRFLVAIVLATAATAPAAYSQSAPTARENRVFELRTYYARAGKLDALNARFRDHTLRLYQKHGITPVGFWSPEGNPDNKLVYLLAYPSRAARDAAWQSLANDPEWSLVRRTTDRSGKLVNYIEEQFLIPTDYSPVVTASARGRNHTYELRVSTIRAGDARRFHAQLRRDGFREFEEQGLKLVGVFLVDQQTGSDVTAVALLAHGDRPTKMARSVDPVLLVTYDEGADQSLAGTITQSDGKLSDRLRPTDYSPLK